MSVPTIPSLSLCRGESPAVRGKSRCSTSRPTPCHLHPFLPSPPRPGLCRTNTSHPFELVSILGATHPDCGSSTKCSSTTSKRRFRAARSYLYRLIVSSSVSANGTALLIRVCSPPHHKSYSGSQQEICVYWVHDESPSIPWLHCACLYLSSSHGMLTDVPILKHIKSNDPLERPVIDPHYFEEEYGNVTLA